MKVVIAQYKEVYKDMQKKAKLPKITFFFIESSVSPTTMHSMSFDHPDHFQPGTPTSTE
jgi:hypothetical protein